MNDKSKMLVIERILRYGVVSREWAYKNNCSLSDFNNTVGYMRKHGYAITTEKRPRDTLYYLDGFVIGGGE